MKVSLQSARAFQTPLSGRGFTACVAFTIRACSRRTFRYALFHLIVDQISFSPENAPVYVAIPVICFFS